MTRRVTNMGTSINNVDNLKFKLKIYNRQSGSYLECNQVGDIEIMDHNPALGNVATSCTDCSHQTMPIIDGQIKEIIELSLNPQIIDGLSWNVAQLLYNQHFSNPISIYNNFN